MDPYGHMKEPSRPAPGELRIPPRWRVVTPDAPAPADGIGLVLKPGAGFGSGAHATTQLCLQAIAALAPRDGRPWQMLDFGSGSGILSIAAAKLGATVAGVEIDQAAIAHAEENRRLNGLEDRVSFVRDAAEAPGPYGLVVANILRPVLLAFAPALTRRLAPGGGLILSGLVATDLPEISVRFGALLDGLRPEAYARGEWRALVWRPRWPVHWT